MKFCQYCNQAYYSGEACPQCGQWMIDMDQSYQPQYTAYDYGMAQSAAYQNYENPPKKRTGLIVFLLLLVVALAAAVAVLLADPFGTTGKTIEKPTATEKAVVQSAWDYYAGVTDVLVDMQNNSVQASKSDDDFIDISTDEGSQLFSDAMDSMFEIIFKLSVYSNPDYKGSIQSGINSLSAEYPQIVEAWNKIAKNQAVDQIEMATDGDTSSFDQSGSWGSAIEALKQSGTEFKNACAAAGFDTADWTIPT